jgi:hypothetical protein
VSPNAILEFMVFCGSARIFDRMISLRPVGYGVTSRMDEGMDRVDGMDEE